MTKAEEAALKAYPHKIEEHPKVMGGSITFDANSQPRAFYKQGYEQAEKDFMERLAKFYPILDYTFRSYLLQDFPELENKVKDCE